MGPLPVCSATLGKVDRSEVDARKLVFSCDYGTKTLSMAYRILRTHDDPTPSSVHDIHFSARDYHAPQQVAWGRNGTFYWGYEVDEKLKRKLIEHADVIELWKLLLYNDHKTSEVAERVQSQLRDQNRTLDGLMTEHLRAVVEAAKTYIKASQTSLELSAKDVDTLPVQLFLSVPQMWKPPANCVMTSAAKAAGIEYVELVYEPQCAAAYYTHNIKDRMPKQLVAGDVLLIADIGGGTGDFVSYEFRDDADAGAKIGLHPAGEPIGALCGSELVNQNFIKWLHREATKDAGTLKKMCSQLGISTATLRKRAAAAFEAIKVDFSVPEAEPSYVTIRGVQGAKRASWEKQLTSQDIVAFFTPVIEDIFRCIEAQMTPRTKTIIIPGGFGRSEYLLGKLMERYQSRLTVMGQASGPVGAYQPVSRGALLRYKDIQARGLPATESFGIGTVETWDPVKHPDATYFIGDIMANGRTCRTTKPNYGLVEPDPYDKWIDVVYERWCSIMGKVLKGEIKSPGKAFTTSNWRQHILKPTETTLSLQVYWTQMDIAEHAPILNGRNCLAEGVCIRKGIEKWGEPLVKQLPNLKALGFEEKEGDFYEIYSRVVLECDGANVHIKWQIALPDTQPYDENGNSRASDPKLTDEEVFELCDAAYNPVPRVSPEDE